MIVILHYQSVLTWQQPAIKTLNEVSAACCEMCVLSELRIMELHHPLS